MRALHIDIIAICAIALAALALLLLWRQHRLRGDMADLRERLRRDAARRDAAEQALADSRARLASAGASQQALKDAERRRIARDLHDDLGQQLLALSFDFGALARQHGELDAALAPVNEQLQLAVRSLRAVVRDLRPETLECGLRQALENQLGRFTRQSGIACQIAAEAPAYAAACDGGLDAVMYRIVQEALSNVARHAGASEVWVGLGLEGGHLSLTLRDNGVGLPHAPQGRGQGLRGIAERVAEAGGRFNVASAPGLGTALTMSFPLHAVALPAESV